MAAEACPVCGQTRAEGERVPGRPCNERCARIRKDANGEAMQLFAPVAVMPGQLPMAEGEPDA